MSTGFPRTPEHDAALNVQGTQLTARVDELQVPPPRRQPSFEEGAVGADAENPQNAGMLSGVLYVNRVLEHTIEALRLRLSVEAKQHGREKDKLMLDKEKQLKKKQDKIDELKTELAVKESENNDLQKTCERKDALLREKTQAIKELEDVVEQTKDYMKELQAHVARSEEEKGSKDSDPESRKRDEEVASLKTELQVLTAKVSELERQLVKAQLMSEARGNKIQLLEQEQQKMVVSFREEIEKMARVTRHEVERIREIMHQQIDEIRLLKDQGMNTAADVKAIRQLLDQQNSRHQVIMKQRPGENVHAPSCSNRVSGNVNRATQNVRSSLPAISFNQGFVGSKLRSKGNTKYRN